MLRLHIFIYLLLVVTIMHPSDAYRVNRDLKLYYKCVCFCKQHKPIHSSVQIAEVLTSDNRIRVPPPGSHIQTTQGQRVQILARSPPQYAPAPP